MSKLNSGHSIMKLLKINIILVVFLLQAMPIAAGDYAADFLRIGVGARSAALGGAFVAAADDPTAFYWNPAGLSNVRNIGLHVDHVPMFDGIAQYNVAGIAMPLRNNMTVAVGWIRLGVDDIPRYAPLQGTRLERLTKGTYRSTGLADGYFADAEDAVMVSFSKKLTFDLGLGPKSRMVIVPMELSLGVTGKFIHQKLDDKVGVGQGVDVGILARTVSRDRVNGEAKSWLGFGLHARDLSRTSIAWNTASKHNDRVESAFVLGLAGSTYFSSFDSRITVSVDQEITPFMETHAGVEFSFLSVAALRAGLVNHSFAAGAGLSFKRFSVDYAFVTHDMGNTHRVSGGVSF